DDDGEDAVEEKRRRGRKSPTKTVDNGLIKEGKGRSEKSKSPDENALADILLGAVARAWSPEKPNSPFPSQGPREAKLPKKSPNKKKNTHGDDDSEWEGGSSSEEDDDELMQG